MLGYVLDNNGVLAHNRDLRTQAIRATNISTNVHISFYCVVKIAIPNTVYIRWKTIAVNHLRNSPLTVAFHTQLHRKVVDLMTETIVCR